jgi:hypothetical protein
MSQFISAVTLFAVFWAALRALGSLVQYGKMPSRMPWAFGVAAWGSLVALFFVLYALIDPVFIAFTSMNINLLMEVGSTWFVASFVAFFLVKSPDILKWEQTKALFFDSLLFHDPTLKKDNIFEAAAFEEVKEIHHSLTGKVLQRERFTEAERPPVDPEQVKKDLESAAAATVANPQLAQDLERLTAGETVNVTDAFRLNSFRKKTHPDYDNIQLMLIEPEHGRLRFQMVFPALAPNAIADADWRFRVLQEIYEVIHALQGELWLLPYEPHVATIQADCLRVETDSFDMPKQTPFARVFIPLAEVRAQSDKIFIVTELTRLKRVEWTS